jgi:carboxyl-terminal processing protease
MYAYFSRFLIVSVFLFASAFCTAQEEHLDYNDIHKVMSEILEQHVDKNKITGDVIKNSLQVYINQFDPQRMYLYESEVKDFTEPSPTKLETVLKQYENNQFTIYEELNTLIQNSIKRARAYRADLIRSGDILFQKSTDNPAKVEDLDASPKRPFPKSLQELGQRIESELVQFIGGERTRYGDRAVIGNKKRTLEAYDRLLRHNENQYLFQDDQGVQLALVDKQNLFVMHILKALTKSLDSHTSFLNSDEAYDMKIRLEKGFHGVGVILERKPEGIVISRLIKDGPAEKSGLVKVNDRIIKINGEIVENYTLEELVNRLRDETKQNVFLILKRSIGESERTIPVTLKRELIAVDEGRVDVEQEKFGDGIIGKITLHSFYQGEMGVTSEKDLRQAIADLKKSGNLKGVILDLRENSGGFLNQAVKVAGLFITNGIVVVSKYSNGEERFYRDMDGKTLFDGPLIVLTSKATASAAEIVAQALQDYGVAVIVGDEHTYGKGTIQSQTVTDGKSTTHFKVTVGKYYTVSGKTPQVRGVVADIVVPSHYSRENIGEEYLQRPLGSDMINASYKDELLDIDKGLKPWYLRYYMPTIQAKETTWVDIIPTLKSKSKERLSVNQEYKLALNAEGDRPLFVKPFGEKKDAVQDYQLKEAVNILKDMITLENKYPRPKVARH